MASRSANLFVLAARPAAQTFLGHNFEFGFDYHYWESRTYTAEIRPIIAALMDTSVDVELIYNRLEIDTDYTGSGMQIRRALEFKS